MDRAQLRQDLLAQLAHLADEAEALKAVVGWVPEPILTGRPLVSSLSFKETYGLLAALDADVFTPFAEALAAGTTPEQTTPDAHTLAHQHDWNAAAMPDLLDRLQQARHRLLAAFRAADAPAWAQAGRLDGQSLDLYGLAHLIIQHDADRLREMGYRLHESHLTSRPTDLPK